MRKSPMMNKIFDKVREGERLTLEDGMELFDSNDLLTIGMMADFVRWKKHPKSDNDVYHR